MITAFMLVNKGTMSGSNPETSTNNIKIDKGEMTYQSHRNMSSNMNSDMNLIEMILQKGDCMFKVTKVSPYYFARMTFNSVKDKYNGYTFVHVQGNYVLVNLIEYNANFYPVCENANLTLTNANKEFLQLSSPLAISAPTDEEIKQLTTILGRTPKLFIEI